MTHLLNKRKIDFVNISRQPLKALRLQNQTNSIIKDNNTEPDKTSDVNIDQISINLKKCLELNEKITSKNVWSNNEESLVNEFYTYTQLLLGRTLKVDYIFVGHCLAAMSRTHGIRVDELYNDVLKLSMALGWRARKNKPEEQNDVTDDNLSPANLPKSKSKVIKRKPKSTLVSNPATLNSKVQTRPFSDPFFVKLNITVGDSSKADRMLMNLMPSRKGFLSSAFWDSEDQKSSWTEPRKYSNVKKVELGPTFNIKNSKLRQSELELVGDDLRVMTCVDLTQPMETDDFDIFDYTMTGDSGLGLHDEFQISPMPLPSARKVRFLSCDSCYASFPNEPTQPSGGMETSTPIQFRGTSSQPCKMTGSQHFRSTNLLSNGDDDLDDFEGPTEPQEFIVDMEPIEDNTSEYSYRPDISIKNYHFRPSHWKFLSLRSSISNKRKPKKRKRILFPLTIEDVVRTNKIKFKDLVPIDEAEMRYSDVLKWQKSSKLAKDFEISDEIFDEFNNASFHVGEPMSHYEPPEFELSSQENDEDHDDYNDYDEPPEKILALDPKICIGWIKPQSRPITYALRPKKFSMSNIKRLSLSVISAETAEEESDVNFSKVYTTVVKIMKESPEETSCGLTFLSVLQSACENKVELQQNFGHISDFKIKSCST